MRNKFLINSIMVIISLLLITACKPKGNICPGDLEVGRESTSPNIILVMTDDQPPDLMYFMPTLRDEIIANGINFTNAFASTPLCCPSRASILSGQYAHNHGVLINRAFLVDSEVFNDQSTIATWLDDAGYRTSFIGKYLNYYSALTPYGHVPPGWDDWHVFLEGDPDHRYYLNYSLSENGEVVEYGDKDKDYSTDVLAAKAFDFIIESRNEPFFLVYSVYAPHQPRVTAERHYDLFRTNEEVSARRPPNFNEEDMSDKPEWIRYLETAEPNRQDHIYQKSLRSLMAVDEAIADFLGALDCIGQRENTLFIFISDHSVAWGEHRLRNDKNCPYEECIAMPYVFYYPAVIAEPREETRMVLNIDLAPTIAHVAGIDFPETVNGVSLLPILDGSVSEWRDAVLIEHWPTLEGFGSTIPTFFSIRTYEWKYVEYETGEIELYDLVNDPYEMENLAYQDGYDLIIKDLASRLEELKQE